MPSKAHDTRRFTFTVARLSALKPPGSGRAHYYDTRTAGLCLCVSSAGSKVYYYYRRIDGRPRRVRIGKFPDVSLIAAREAADELTGEIAKHRDPAAERRARREAATLGELFAHWLETHAKPHKKTWPEDQRKFDMHLSHWRARRLESLAKVDIQRWHRDLGKKHGHYLANRAFALLRSLFGVAGDLGFDGPNPCIGVKRFKEESRQRFLQPDEMRTFFESLADELPLWRDFFLTLLLTGARRSNVALMRWDEVDLDRAIWYLPGEKAKGGTAIVVALPDPALAVLRARRMADPTGEWVFPSERTDGPISDARKAWERIRRRSGLTDLRMHDLRRSLGSWQAGLGVSLPIIGKSLGHRDHKATQVYARLQLDPVRDAVNRATAAMLAAGGVKLIQEGGHDGEGK